MRQNTNHKIGKFLFSLDLEQAAITSCRGTKWQFQRKEIKKFHFKIIGGQPLGYPSDRHSQSAGTLRIRAEIHTNLNGPSFSVLKFI